MTNFIVSYDLNGDVPSHTQVDEALANLGAARGRILETVWYVGYSGSLETLFNAVDGLMTKNDQVAVIEASNMMYRNLLVTDNSIQANWLIHG